MHPLYKQIQDDIRQQIASGLLRAGDMVPSEKALAAQYNVSQITSKNALNGLVEEGLLVRFRGKGTFVKQSRDLITEPDEGDDMISVALILPTMKTKVDQRLLDALEKYASAASYELLIRITRESQQEEARAVERFRERGVQGFIVFPVEQENYNDAILRLSLDRVPLVLVDRYLKEIRTYSVSSDNSGGTESMISAMLTEGHRSIIYLSTEIANTVTEERSKGYESAYMKHGLPIDKALWCLLPLPTIAEGRALEEIVHFLQQHKEATAVFAANAELARYARQALDRLHREDLTNQRFPRPVLAAFDDPDLPGVPYVRQQEDEIGRLAIELLGEQLQERYEPRRVIVPVHLHTEDSILSPPQ
ncbi:GntR family transcriptional regulator [Paenibacillus daejeonensis]|uniref:GntR family transcriptional regulator n=1 Tax=Paenibacillus daejeonensis TaxID=135193 RepID=UPI00038282D4|nr:GntR family transcriptional regulator [Paenibacillus daejeonensis]